MILSSDIVVEQSCRGRRDTCRYSEGSNLRTIAQDARAVVSHVRLTHTVCMNHAGVAGLVDLELSQVRCVSTAALAKSQSPIGEQIGGMQDSSLDMWYASFRKVILPIWSNALPG